MKLRTTPYQNYADYLSHQASKLEGREQELKEWSAKKDRTSRFEQKFRPFVERLSLQGPVLCLGARLGEEVRAFRRCELDAIGVDIQPGTENPDVIAADFHHLPFQDHTFQGIYSNVLDHVYDLTLFMNEVLRVVQPDGWIYFDIGGGYEELGRTDPWASLSWAKNNDLVQVLQPYMRRIWIHESRGIVQTLIFQPQS